MERFGGNAEFLAQNPQYEERYGAEFLADYPHVVQGWMEEEEKHKKAREWRQKNGRKRMPRTANKAYLEEFKLFNQPSRWFRQPDSSEDEEEADNGDASSSKSVRRSKVKVKKNHQKFLRTAEKAVKYFNKNNEGSDLELVEVVSGHKFFTNGPWVHINFKAKSKSTLESGSDNSPAQLFFAEADFYYKDNEIKQCVELKKLFVKSCFCCYPRYKIRHPIRGLLGSLPKSGIIEK